MRSEQRLPEITYILHLNVIHVGSPTKLLLRIEYFLGGNRRGRSKTLRESYDNT